MLVLGWVTASVHYSNGFAGRTSRPKPLLAVFTYYINKPLLQNIWTQNIAQECIWVYNETSVIGPWLTSFSSLYSCVFLSLVVASLFSVDFQIYIAITSRSCIHKMDQWNMNQNDRWIIFHWFFLTDNILWILVLNSLWLAHSTNLSFKNERNNPVVW